MQKLSKKEKNVNGIEETEETTKYGEFVSSYFSWMGLDRQKRRTEEIEKMTKK